MGGYQPKSDIVFMIPTGLYVILIANFGPLTGDLYNSIAGANGLSEKIITANIICFFVGMVLAVAKSPYAKWLFVTSVSSMMALEYVPALELVILPAFLQTEAVVTPKSGPAFAVLFLPLVLPVIAVLIGAFSLVWRARSNPGQQN